MDDLCLLIKSRYPIVYVETYEEDRLARLLESVCRNLNLALFIWSVTAGLRRYGADQPVYDTQDPAKSLLHIHASRLPAVYLLQDFHPYLSEPRIVRQFREIAQDAGKFSATFVLSAPALELPAELRKHAARFQMKLPDEGELRQVVLDTFRELNRGRNYINRLGLNELSMMARNLRGLTIAEARRIVSRCVLDDDMLDGADLARAVSIKKESIQQSGILEYFDVQHDLPPLGGLRGLKAWLRRFGVGFSEKARQMGLRPPRGVLLVGIQGCGKSLAAKTIALEWGLPLVRLDPSQLFDKYVGESEKNLRRAFETAEAVSPVVLWIDEIEKAFAGSSSSESDAGLGRRLFGSFLTWMQEKKDAVFVAATANDLSAIPPELQRKGRFDEIFFIDLPDAEERREIFNIHLKRRSQQPEQLDLSALVAASEGFSGAEIEQAVVAALYGMLAENAEHLTTERLLGELRGTVPLSRSRREHVAEFRQYAQGRFLPAR